jgi:hypothetical protein
MRYAFLTFPFAHFRSEDLAGLSAPFLRYYAPGRIGVGDQIGSRVALKEIVNE